MRRPVRQKGDLLSGIAEDWSHWPVEAQIGSFALPGFLLLCAHVLALIPAVRDIAGEDTIQAGGLISAIFTVLLFKATFGSHASKAKREKNSGRVLNRVVEANHDDMFDVPDSVHHNFDSVKEQIRRLASHDQAFSEVLLHQYLRGILPVLLAANTPEKRLALSPFVAGNAWQGLERLFLAADNLTAEFPRITDISESTAWTDVQVAMRVLAAQDGQHRVFSLQWHMRRSGSARSQGPADVLSLNCPSCGAPVEIVEPGGHCKFCDLGITHGQQSWQIIDVTGNPNAPFIDPAARPDDGGDHATALPPPLEDRSLDRDLRALSGRHPDFGQRDFEVHAAQVFAAYLQALAGRSPQSVAHALHPNLLAALEAQVAIDEAGGLQRQQGPVHIDQLEWSSVGGDGWYEVLVVRAYVTLPWCVTDDEGNVVDGNPDVTRSLSRYLFFQHPVDESLQLARWRLWKVATPNEYAA